MTEKCGICELPITDAQDAHYVNNGDAVYHADCWICYEQDRAEWALEDAMRWKLYMNAGVPSV